ncbi:sensor histidine kinase [Paenibacillus thalictri]|uniref:Sensor histidine kinase n=1 Tax=Paenibacillus thalictri TaxID=2527873 RepID=A0A4Q9DP20_9BACL|nr:sensor histidine kinase [Paenibacillus thalictri]TBL75715.1 sensor histidine kinase [Paenibacillus thalictri]
MSVFSKFFIKKSSVQQKMLISFLCLAVLPLGLFGYISLTITKRTIEQQAGEAKLTSLGQISQKLEIMASDLTAISNIYFSNEDLRSLLLSPVGNQAYQERAKSQFLTKLIVTYRYAYTWLEYYTSIFGFNGFELHTFYNASKIGVDAIKSEPWYPEALQKNGSILWASDPSAKLLPTINEDHYVSVMRLLKDFENDKALGLLMINVGESFLYKQYASATQQDERMLLLDDKGIIISAADKSQLGMSMEDQPYFKELVGENAAGHFSVKENGRPMLVTYHKVESTGWTIVCYTPLDTLLKNIDRAEWYTLAVFAFLLLLSVAVSYVIARRLSIPIRKLFNSMKRVEMGDLTVRSMVKGNDEIGELAQNFNRMVGRIEALRDQVIEEQELKRRTELQNLQSQINTHFLYNTLASIRSMLITEPWEKVDSVIVSLVKLLKKTLSAESEYIAIAEEVENLRNYVHIQEARQYEKLHVEFDIDEQIYPYSTLKLLLQPLVENAIFHGIEPKQGPGTIVIKGWMQEGRIHFLIADDGIGFPAVPPSAPEGGLQLAESPATAGTLSPADAAQGPKAPGVPVTEQFVPEGHDAILKAQLEAPAGGMGLRNVLNRMRLHFGEAAALELRRRPGGGTEAHLVWPVFIRAEELKHT